MNKQKGSAVGDYLLLIAAIAGVLIPLVMKYFGEPILKTFTSQRGRLVEFVAQTPVRQPGKTVPNSWFGQEKMAEYPGGEDLSGGEDLTDEELQGGNDLKEGKDLKGGRTMRNPRPLRGGKQLKGGSQLRTGELSGGQTLGGGAGGDGFGGGAGSANDADFFDKGAGPPAGPSGGGEGVNAGKRAGAPTSNFEGGDGVGGGGGGGGDKKAKQDDKGGAASDASSIAQGKSKQDLSVSVAEEEARKRSAGFDWWTIIKVLIILLILFLLAIIALSNLKKR